MLSGSKIILESAEKGVINITLVVEMTISLENDQVRMLG